MYISHSMNLKSYFLLIYVTGGSMLKNLKEEILSKILCIQFIKKLNIKSNAQILINCFYI